MGPTSPPPLNFVLEAALFAVTISGIGCGQAGVIGGQRNEIVFNGNRNRATHIEWVTARDSHIRRRDQCLVFLEFLTE
jgi:hypothetical protein